MDQVTNFTSDLGGMRFLSGRKNGARRYRLAGAAVSVLLVAGACSSGGGNESAEEPDSVPEGLGAVEEADGGGESGGDEAAFAPTPVFRWNQMSLAAVRHEVNPAPPAVARSLFVVHTAMYEAWAAYDADAAGPVTGQNLDVEGSSDDQMDAVSVAAYWAIQDQFPGFDTDTNAPASLLEELVGEPNDDPIADSPEAIGLAAATAVLDDRQNDGANEAGGYAEPENYSFPQWTEGSRPGARDWTPLKVPTGAIRDESGAPIVDLSDPSSFEGQEYVGPHWGDVRPFAIATGDALRPPEPPRPGSDEPYVDALGKASTSDEAFRSQFEEVLEYSATLTDEQKLIAEYWADGPRSETPPGHWNLLAQGISARDGHDLEEDVKMYFALNGALHDAAIVAWDAKRAYTSARPVTVIPWLFSGDTVLAWGGPGKGTTEIDAKDWAPYQKDTFITPGFPEYVSGHSSFSAAAAEVLTNFTGDATFFDGEYRLPWDHDGDGEQDLLGQVVFRPGSGKFERMPEVTVTVEWPTFKDAADSAGISRLYGGIHIQDGDLHARSMGQEVGEMAWDEVNDLWAS